MNPGFLPAVLNELIQFVALTHTKNPFIIIVYLSSFYYYFFFMNFACEKYHWIRFRYGYLPQCKTRVKAKWVLRGEETVFSQSFVVYTWRYSSEKEILTFVTDPFQDIYLGENLMLFDIIVCNVSRVIPR